MKIIKSTNIQCEKTGKEDWGKEIMKNLERLKAKKKHNWLKIEENKIYKRKNINIRRGINTNFISKKETRLQEMKKEKKKKSIQTKVIEDKKIKVEEEERKREKERCQW